MNRLLAVFFSVVLSGGIGLTLLAGTPAQAFHFPWDQGHDTTDWNDPNDPGPCDEPNCDPCKSSGSPVYIPTGHFIWSETDIAMPGRPGISLTRTYNSNDPRDSAFGNGWSSGCETGLFKAVTFVDDGSGNSVQSTQYLLRFPNGKRYTYSQDSSGSISPPPGRFDQVAPQADGTVRLLDQSGGQQIFNTDGTVKSQIDSNGIALNYDYDSNGQLTRLGDNSGRFIAFDYDSRGRVATLTDHTNRVWSYGYDVNGNLISVTDPLGGIRRYEYRAYTPTGDGHTYYQLTKVTDETGVIATQVVYSGDRVQSYTVGANRFTYSYNLGASTVTKTDILGSRWLYVYDTAGLITRKTDPLNNVELFQYDGDGQLIQYTDQLNRVWTTTYDGLGRKLSQTNPLNETKTWEYAGDNPRPVKVISAAGRETEVAYDGNGNMTQLIDPGGAVTSMTWDGNGNLLSVQDPLGNQTSTTPNALGLAQSSTDGLGRTTQFTYDALGSLIAIENAQAEAIQLDYDALGRLIATTDPSGKTASYAYDAAGRLLSVTDPDGNTTNYAYDGFGRLQKRTAPDAREYTYDYRQDNLLAQVTQPGGGAKTLGYDAAKRATSINVGGIVTTHTYDARHHLTKAVNPTGTVEIAYDAAGRTIQETVNGQSITFALSPDGEKIRMAALGRDTDYTRSPRGLVTRIAAPEGDYVLAYDAKGQRTQLALPNGATVDYDYNAASQMTNLDYSGPFTAAYEYTHNAAGMLAQWRGDGADWLYQYDQDSALVQATHGTAQYSYSSDDAGNLLIGNGRIYDAANRLSEDNDFAYTYDQRGNLTQKQNKTTGARSDYTWNALNQLIKVERFPNATASVADKILAYTYGPLGRRWSRSEDGVVEHFVYDGADRIATLDAAGNLLSAVTFGPAVDEPLGMTDAQGQRYFHADHLGSIIALTDNSSISSRYAYDPFGGTVSVTGTDTSPFRYTGREYEADDLYFYRSRYYDPTIQRFLSEDTIGFFGGDLNLYRYVGNNPVNFTDPSGNIWPAVLVVWGAIEVGLAIYDAYDTASTVFDPCTSGWEKAIAGGLFIVGAVAPGGGYSAADDIAEAAVKNSDDLVDLYRAVSPDEFYDIFDNGLFRPGPNSLDAKQFGHDLNEVLNLSDHLPDTAAIVKVEVPRSVFDQLDHTPVDSSILKSGATTVQPDQLDLFNNSVINIEHAY